MVAVPARNEAERIPDCLHALASQQEVGAFEVVLLLNNCTDDTAAVVNAVLPTLPVSVHVIEHTLPRVITGAGMARRIAMERAARLAGPDGVLLTTDADGKVAPDWIARNLAALARGADAVAGQAVIDPADAARIPAHLHEDDARECGYAALLDEIDWLLDPDSCDAWPRHGEESGASIAVTVRAYRRAGGMPATPAGEDRAFFAAMRAVDGRIRHAPELRVTVSGRTDGRAAGGMAETIRRRMIAQDAFVDARLERALTHALRATLRAEFRAARSARGRPMNAFDGNPDAASGHRAPASRIGVSPALLSRALSLPFEGGGWAMLEHASDLLRRQPLAWVDLPRETARALRIRNKLLRSHGVTHHPARADPAATAARAA
ncbi:MAG: glycosyltransferase [Acetobacteraceae bacterium]